MQDGIIAGNGSSRYLKTVAAALSLYPSYEDFITALIAGTFPIDLNGINEAGWSRQGTPLNKGTLLSDTTETKIWGSAGNHTVDQALGQILGSIGYSLIKEYTSPGSFTHTFDRKYTDVFVVVVGAGGGGGVGGMGKTGQQSGRGNGGGGAGGNGGMAVSPNGGNEIVSRNNGLNGDSTSAFGLVALGGEGAKGENFGLPGNSVGASYDVPGSGGNYTQPGENGRYVDIIGIYMAGGGGGGANGENIPNKERGASGGSTGGGYGGDGASQSANGTDGGNGSKGGGGGGAGGGCNYTSNQKRSGTGGQGGNGYVAIYGRG
jgi:hypothetical protein